MDNPYQISTDPVWHRWIDGVIILFIGIATGIIILGSVMTTEVVTTTRTTEVMRRSPSTPQIESGIQIDVPSGAAVEEI